MLTNLLLAMAMASPSGGVPASGSGAVSSPASMVPASRLEFVENRGQWPSEARFMAELGGMTLWLTESGSVMDVHSLSEVSPVLTGSDGGRATRLRRGHIVRSEFVGSDGKPVAGSVAGVGESRSETVRHYYLGNDPSRHAEFVPAYGEVHVSGLYPGVDARWYDDGGNIRYDLLLAPGADPSQIRLRHLGTDRVSVTRDGDLRLDTSLGPVYERGLEIYQDLPSGRRRVEGSYRLHGDGTVGFEVGDHDPTRGLVIDPLLWAASFGGAGASAAAYDVKIDGDGNIVFGGMNDRSDFPAGLNGAYTLAGGRDVCVVRVSSDGLTRQLVVMFGGNQEDYPNEIALDESGAVVVSGVTSSTNMPTTAGLQVNFGGDWDGLGLKLNANGTRVWSTYVGGSGRDESTGVAILSNGAVVLAGESASANFPTSLGVVKPTFSGTMNGFLVRVHQSGTTFGFRTLFGGSNSKLFRVKVRPSGTLVVSGTILSNDLATTPNALQSALWGESDAFVAEVNSSATQVLYASYYGGSGADHAASGASVRKSAYCDVDDNGDVLLAFPSSVFDMPAARVYQFGSPSPTTLNLVVARLRLDGSVPLAVAVLGGSSNEIPRGVVSTRLGSVAVAVETRNGGAGLPITADAMQGFGGGAGDGYACRLSADFATVQYGTYGGADFDPGDAFTGVALRNGVLAISGYTWNDGLYHTISHGPGTNNGWTAWIAAVDTRQPLRVWNFDSAEIDELVEHRFQARVDGDPANPGDIAFSLDFAPDGATIHPTTGWFSWTPTEEQGPGVYTFEVVATDGAETAYKEITLVVREVSDNNPPMLNPIGNKSGATGYPVTFTATASDPDAGQSLTFSLENSPSGAGIHPNTGAFSWTPSTPGTYNVTVKVADDGFPPLSDSETFQIVVTNLGVDTLTLDPTSVVGVAQNSTGTVALNQPAPSGGVSVALASDNQPVGGVPSAVSVPEGQSSATFTVTTTAVSSPTNVTITATLGNSKQAVLAVNPPSLGSFQIAPLPIVPGQSTLGIVELNGAAPAGGRQYSVAASHPDLVTVPATITVPAGQSQYVFPIQTSDSDPDAVVTITLSRPGDTMSADLSFFSVQAPPTLAPHAISSGTVVVSKPLDADVTAFLSTSNSNLTIPSSVTILAGQTSATFPITAGAGTGPTTITATLPPPINQQTTAVVVVSGDPWVEGTATMNGRANLEGVAAVLQLRDPGTGAVVATYPTTLGAGGTFAVQVAQSGTFDLALKLPTSLRRKVSGVAIDPATGATGVSFALTNGDVNGDNAVSIADFLQLRAAYGSSTGSGTWNPNADLNGDGSVGLADFLILRAAFGRSGD